MTITVDDFDLDIRLGAPVDMAALEPAMTENCFTQVIPRTCACA